MSQSYTSLEELPKWFVVLGMIIALIAPYEIAGALMLKPTTTTGEINALLTGLVMLTFTVPVLSVLVLGITKVWYDNDYWYHDMANTRVNPIILLIIIAFPIAFVFSINSSLGLYFGLTVLTAVFLVTIFYRFQPAVPTSEGYRFGLFWSALVTLIVMTTLSAYLVVFRGVPLTDLLFPSVYLERLVAPFTTDGYFILAANPVNTLQIVTEAGFLAFVVGFSEEGWARLSIPMMGAYFGNNIFISVWWLGITWLSLHAVVITYTALQLGLASITSIALNIVILGLISLFIFYVFAKTGDYISSALAHGFYDLMISLGTIGLVIAVILLALNYKYYRL
jgi:hypothetical protein